MPDNEPDLYNGRKTGVVDVVLCLHYDQPEVDGKLVRESLHPGMDAYMHTRVDGWITQKHNASSPIY